MYQRFRGAEILGFDPFLRGYVEHVLMNAHGLMISEQESTRKIVLLGIRTATINVDRDSKRGDQNND